MAEDTMGTRGSRWRVHGRPTLPYYISATLFNPYLFTVSTVRHSPVVQSSLRCDTLRQRALIDTVLYHGDTWGNGIVLSIIGDTLTYLVTSTLSCLAISNTGDWSGEYLRIFGEFFFGFRHLHCVHCCLCKYCNNIVVKVYIVH